MVAAQGSQNKQEYGMPLFDEPRKSEQLVEQQCRNFLTSFPLEESGEEPIFLDLSKVPVTTRIDLVDGLIPKDHISLLYAEGGKAKSYLALYLCYCLATGQKFLGCDVLASKALY